MTQNYVPILFFLSCVGLYFAYYSYARNFEHYMSVSGEIQDFEPLFVLPAFGIVPGRLLLPVDTPFRPYVWYAVGGLAIVLIASRIFERAPSGPKPPGKQV